MSSFDNTKYDVELNSVGYRINGYQKSELAPFIPRLAGGEQEESDFDLLRSKTIHGFEGGTLQRIAEDPTSIFASETMYPIYDDGVLYPIAEPVVQTSGILGATKAVMTAHVEDKDVAFVAGRTYAGVNFVKKIASNYVVTTLTIPASLSGATRPIKSMAIWNDQLWVCTGNNTMWYMSISASTLNDIVSGTAYFSRLVVFKGALYGTSGSDTNTALYKYTGTTSTRSNIQVGTTGQSDADTLASLVLYNNRIYLTRQDGLYAYDGVAFNVVEDASNNQNVYNYRFPIVLKGYMYYFMPDGWYRYNGSLIEKLYDISEIGFPSDVFLGKNRIWMVYRNSSLGSSRYDKAMGFDYSTGTNVNGRVMCFNGKGIYTYARLPTWVKNTGTEDFAGQGEAYNGFWFKDILNVLRWHEKANPNDYYSISTDELNINGNKTWQIVSSVFDLDFPQVYKHFEEFEIALDGYVSSDQNIGVYYRTSGFDGSTGWTQFGSVQSISQLFTEVWKSDWDGILGKKFQIKVSGTTAAGYGIAKLVMKYILMPEYKNQWQINFLCYGDNSVSPLLLADGTESTQTVQTLRGNIYASRLAYNPVNFIDIDQLDLNEDLDAVETVVTLNDVSLLKGYYGFIKIDSEIMYWYAKAGNDLTVLRGQLGTSAATHTNNSKVFILYRVIVRSIQNERAILDDATEQLGEDKSIASEISLVLQEV